MNAHIKIRGATTPKNKDRLKRLLPDDSTRNPVVRKALSFNLNFSFLIRISLLLISSSYPIVLTSVGGPRSRPYCLLPEKFLGYRRESNPGPLGWQSDMLTTTPNRRSPHLYIPSKTATLVPEFSVEDLPLERTATLVNAFAVKDLPLSRIFC